MTPELREKLTSAATGLGKATGYRCECDLSMPACPVVKKASGRHLDGFHAWVGLGKATCYRWRCGLLAAHWSVISTIASPKQQSLASSSQPC